jgi:3-oxoacyl-[acyl-carrier protein] reductase
MSADFGLAGKKAIVIGGGFGMGRASVAALAAEGVEVAVVDLELDRAETVAAAARDAGGAAFAFAQNVEDDEGLAAMVSGIADRLGGVDVLVDVVGGSSWGAALEMDPAVLDFDSRHNLRHFFVAAQAFARAKPSTTSSARSILGIASISGIVSAPNHAAYGAAKAGLISLVHTFAQEWGPLGIRVNAIAPGAIRTDRNNPGPEFTGKVNAGTPLGRMGKQDEIGTAALFLSSDLASYVTGQVLVVDGGATTNYPFPLS